MTLNKFERRLLANQYHILSLLDQSNAGHYEKMREALESGYESAYEDAIFGSIFDGLPADESALVIDAMDMYFAIQRSYDALDDKTGIEEGRTKFPGFDGNHETAYMGYARFVVEKEGRFRFLMPYSEDFNSHTPMLDQYRRMIDVWKLTKNRYELTRDDIIAILEASRAS
jgi:uncharacterized protein YfbU (UPF0304 family)